MQADKASQAKARRHLNDTVSIPLLTKTTGFRLRGNKDQDLMSKSMLDILDDQDFDLSVSSITESNSCSRDNSAPAARRFSEIPQAQILHILDREKRQNLANKKTFETILGKSACFKELIFL